jgi:hypothetical protein
MAQRGRVGVAGWLARPMPACCAGARQDGHRSFRYPFILMVASTAGQFVVPRPRAPLFLRDNQSFSLISRVSNACPPSRSCSGTQRHVPPAVDRLRDPVGDQRQGSRARPLGFAGSCGAESGLGAA